MLSSKPGRGIIPPKTTDSPAIADSGPSKDTSSTSSTEAVLKVLKTAERNIDIKNVKKRRGRKEMAIQRTYQITISNIQRMEKLNEVQGSDFSWQINTALSHWFNTVHPNIVINQEG